MLSVLDLKNILTTQGITEEYSDEQLQQLIDDAVMYIAFHADIDLTPQLHMDVQKINRDSSLLNYYPVHEISELTIGGRTITNYTLNKESGIIYFPRIYTGMLKAKYTTCLSEDDINTYVNPIISRLITYNLTDTPTRDATSIREGDVSITLDSSLTKGALIQQMIYNLKRRFSTKVDLI